MWSVVALAVLTSALSGPWVAPVAPDGANGRVIRAFERPADRFAPGHRGIDVRADAGTPVRSVGPGTVTFVGDVAGVPSVTIDHRTVLSSYLPVDSNVEVGQTVEAGQVIGIVATRGRHCRVDCLHLGIRRAPTGPDPLEDPYVDPLSWIHRRPVLKPSRS